MFMVGFYSPSNTIDEIYIPSVIRCIISLAECWQIHFFIYIFVCLFVFYVQMNEVRMLPSSLILSCLLCQIGIIFFAIHNSLLSWFFLSHFSTIFTCWWRVIFVQVSIRWYCWRWWVKSRLHCHRHCHCTLALVQCNCHRLIRPIWLSDVVDAGWLHPLITYYI